MDDLAQDHNIVLIYIYINGKTSYFCEAIDYLILKYAQFCEISQNK